jgi:hypothetical protein
MSLVNEELPWKLCSCNMVQLFVDLMEINSISARPLVKCVVIG